MKKRITVALIAVLAIAAMFVFLPIKIACAILMGSVLVAAFIGITAAAAKNWDDLEKKDPKKAKELWNCVLQEMERSRYML